MKSLFFTIIVFALVILGYDYFFAPVGQKMIFKSLNVPPPSVPIVVAPKPSAPNAPIATPQTPTAPTPAPAMPAPSTAPVATAPTTDADGFPLPKYDSIDSLTKGWTFIPKSAFPRQVKLMRETEFKLSVGATKVPAGGIAFAMAMDNGTLTVAPTETSSARAFVGLDDTDLKSTLVAGYENWKPLRTAALKKVWARRKAAASAGDTSIGLAGSTDTNGIPLKSPTGGYALLFASMSSGQVTDITPEKIKRWGDPEQKTIEGVAYWTVPIRYDTNTIFGPMEAEAEARIKNGKVVGWYFTGSGEEVP